jgi:hypothetical protein
MTTYEREAYAQFIADAIRKADDSVLSIVYETLLGEQNAALLDALYALVHLDADKQARVRWYIGKIQ